ncbi:hypothetical protein [Spirosoma endophyticum]|uniref:Uncharacterized protein n=1 Tax=Spirosoma endophyticum TaxID=662367 RepID=A0A1I2CT79_9BACT|nr:hypothetical protein [Spirosoma endophyticum]SFE70940.1 hypothetical protein SAMN05216167_11832 [Spirosoma endophyticum]
MLGYIFFFITVLFYIGLAMIMPPKPITGGNNSMGYGLALVYLSLGFAVSSLILTISIRSAGGFDWVSSEALTRTGLVLLAWLGVALTIFFCALFKQEWHEDGLYPSFLHWIAMGYGQLWIPLLWLMACLLSLNPAWLSTLPLQAFNIPFWVGLSISTLYSGGLLVGYVRESVQQAQARVARQLDDEKRWHQIRLDEVAAYKSGDPIITLLGYSGRYQDDDVRQAALVKIKAHPNWEAELLDLLTHKRGDREVYNFLDGNLVDHPGEFVEPLKQSILRLSASIKADIKDSNNLQSWSFEMYGVDQLLRAIDDQFSGQGNEFYPDVIRLQQALNTPPPERFKGIHFATTDLVNTWLARHR